MNLHSSESKDMSEVSDHPADSYDNILVSSHLQHPTLLPAVCPPFEEFFSRDRDVEFCALALLDACALARLSVCSLFVCAQLLLEFFLMPHNQYLSQRVHLYSSSSFNCYTDYHLMCMLYGCADRVEDMACGGRR